MLSKPRRSAAAPATPAAREKVHTVMHEFKHGELHSGSKQGPQVRKKKQAIAIALNQARKAG
jgi:hypothetical protein